MAAPSDPARGRFATTRWSLVLSAGRATDPRSREALAELCANYWYPVYAYLRRRGESADDARDLTQAFFARLLEKGGLESACGERGRFRSYLLAAVQHFLANDRQRSRAARRGGGSAVLSLDFASAERMWRDEPQDRHTPESLFELRWALALLERSLGRLRREYARSGKEQLFERTKAYLTGDGPAYRDAAAELGLTEGAVKVAVHRLRRRFGEMLRRDVAETLGPGEETDEELRHLLRVLGEHG